MVSGLAVVCVRNEAIHIRRCLTDLIASGLEVRLIDNGSTDATRDIASEFLGGGLLAIDNLPWSGVFSLTDQLRMKQEIYKTAKHDWLVHADADEWLMTPVEGQSLIEGLEEATRQGYTCINFHEIVFVPLPGEDFETESYASSMMNYYFFQPSYPRLHRAWRRDSGAGNVENGGHLLAGEGLRTSPLDFILRHYIVLSAAFAQRKYISRLFSAEDLNRGWHSNRTGIRSADLTIKISPFLRSLTYPASRQFDLSAPAQKHFWQW